MAQAYPSFCSMKQLKVLLLPPGWDASQSQGYPSSMLLVPIYTPEVCCLRKQHDGRDWASNHRPSDLMSNALTTTPPRSHLTAL